MSATPGADVGASTVEQRADSSNGISRYVRDVADRIAEPLVQIVELSGQGIRVNGGDSGMWSQYWPTRVAFMGDAAWCRFATGLVAPGSPTWSRMPSKHLKARAGGARFNQGILLIRLSAVFTLATLDHVYLTTCWGQGAHGALHAEQEDLRHIAKVEANASAVWSAILSRFGPHDIADVTKPL